MSKFYTDRTRTVAYQRCPRRRWWEYEWEDRGVSPTRLALPLAVGIFTHQCMEKMLGAVLENGEPQRPPRREQMRAIFAEFWDDWMGFAAKRGLNLAPGGLGEEMSPEQNEYLTMKEQGCLIEGMVWAYWHEVLPKLLDNYTIIEVEQDEDPIGFGPQAFWQAKADALLKNKHTGADTVFSLKTTATWDKRKANEGNVDMQGKSELWALEQRLGRKLDNVLMHYMVKGSLLVDKGMGNRMAQYSPLIRGYKSAKGKQTPEDVLAGNPGAPEYFWRWEYPGPDGKAKRLHYKSHLPFRVWMDDSPLTIEQWIDMLAEQKIQKAAGSCLAEQFVTPPPYERNQQRIDDWQQATFAQELRVKEAKGRVLSYVDQGDFDAANEELNVYFPMYTHSCNYPTACPFKGVCHNPMTGELASEVNPLKEEAGRFIWREAHHEGEARKLEED